MKISLEEVVMEEKKDKVVNMNQKEETVNVETWFYRNRKVIFAVACCVIGYKLGYVKGKQEALSVIDHTVKEIRDCFEIGRF